MTMNQLTNALYKTSEGHYFNGERWDKPMLKSFLGHWFGCDGIERLYPNEFGVRSLVMEIRLPDGEWFIDVTQMADGYMDYSIPADRAQEARWFPDFVRVPAR